MMLEFSKLSNMRLFVTSQVPPETRHTPIWSNSYHVTKKRQNMWKLEGLTKSGMGNSNMMLEFSKLPNLRLFVTSQMPPGTRNTSLKPRPPKLTYNSRTNRVGVMKLGKNYPWEKDYRLPYERLLSNTFLNNRAMTSSKFLKWSD